MGNSHASRTQPNLDLGLRDNGKFSIGIHTPVEFSQTRVRTKGGNGKISIANTYAC